MLGIMILLVFVGAALVVLYSTRKGTRSSIRQRPEKPTMLYAPGSVDEAGQMYHSSRKDGSMPFPLGKKKERKRTDTFRGSSGD